VWCNTGLVLPLQGMSLSLGLYQQALFTAFLFIRANESLPVLQSNHTPYTFAGAVIT
jgi:hypothetical protein